MDGIIPVVTEYNGVLATTSRAVAEQFGKAHKNVLRDIQRIIEQLENSESGREFSQSNFGSAFYQDSMNRKKPMYLLTRDALTLLVMCSSGEKAEVAYINAFNRMEALLRGDRGTSPELRLLKHKVDAMEQRLEAVEQMLGKEKARLQAAAEPPTVGEIFFRALREALDSGEYYLKDKWKRETGEEPGILLGVQDGSRVFVRIDYAYKIYCAAAGESRITSRQGLWAVLEQSSEIYPRSNGKGHKHKRIMVKRQPVTVISFDHDKLGRSVEQ